MADWFGLQVVLLLLLLSGLLAALVPALRSYYLSCTRRRGRKRTNLTEADPAERLGQICSSTPVGRRTRSSRNDLEKLFIPRLDHRLDHTMDHSQHVVDLPSELNFHDQEDHPQYTLGDQTLHNLFCKLSDVSRSFVVEDDESEVKEEELLEKHIHDETISDSMVNITFVC